MSEDHVAATADKAGTASADRSERSEAGENRPGESRLEETRLGEIQGDRPCTACGYTLFGQPIVRETTYGMLIARCPECGTVAALQEYPALSRWAPRLVGFAAAGWVLALVLWFVGSGLLALAPSLGMREAYAFPYSERLVDAYTEWFRALPEDEARIVLNIDNGVTTWNAPTPPMPADAIPFDTVRFNAWATPSEGFLKSGAVRSVASQTHWIAGLRGDGVTFLLLIAGAWCLIAIVWSLLLVHLGVVGRLTLGLVQILLAALTYSAFIQGSASPAARTYWNLRSYADEAAWMPAIIAGCVAAACGLALGTFVGRPLCRLTIRLALPPRLRVPFHALWHVDGKHPPRPTASERAAA